MLTAIPAQRPRLDQPEQGRFRAGLFFLLSAFILLGCLEIWFHSFDNFYDRLFPSFHEKQLRYTGLLNGEISADTVIVGSSTAMFGIDPAPVSAATGWRIYNAGQLGYAPANLSGAVIEELVASHHVKRIIYAFDSWSLSSEMRDRSRVDTGGRENHCLGNAAVFRNREIFFFWLREVAEHGWRNPSQAWERSLTEGGRIIRMGETHLEDNGHLAVEAQLNPDWLSYIRPSGTTFVPEQYTAFERALDAAALPGVEIVLVRMPEFQRTYREHGAAHAALSRYLASEMKRRHLRFVDFSQSGAFPFGEEGYFFDIHHLNAEGSKVLSRRLAAALAPR